MEMQIEIGMDFQIKIKMIDKARNAKHVSNTDLIKFCTTTIRKEKILTKNKN